MALFILRTPSASWSQFCCRRCSGARYCTTFAPPAAAYCAATCLAWPPHTYFFQALLDLLLYCMCWLPSRCNRTLACPVFKLPVGFNHLACPCPLAACLTATAACLHGTLLCQAAAQNTFCHRHPACLAPTVPVQVYHTPPSLRSCHLCLHSFFSFYLLVPSCVSLSSLLLDLLHHLPSFSHGSLIASCIFLVGSRHAPGSPLFPVPTLIGLE